MRRTFIQAALGDDPVYPMALWDIAGKAMGQPVYRLLGGGFRDKLRAYASILAALPNSSLLEYCVEQGPLRQTLTRERLPVVDGYVMVPQEPGLGITLDEEVLARYRMGMA